MASFANQAMIESLRSFWDRGKTVERVGYVVGAALFVSGVVHLAQEPLEGDALVLTAERTCD